MGKAYDRAEQRSTRRLIPLCAGRRVLYGSVPAPTGLPVTAAARIWLVRADSTPLQARPTNPHNASLSVDGKAAASSPLCRTGTSGMKGAAEFGLVAEGSDRLIECRRAGCARSRSRASARGRGGRDSYSQLLRGDAGAACASWSSPWSRSVASRLDGRRHHPRLVSAMLTAGPDPRVVELAFA